MLVKSDVCHNYLVNVNSSTLQNAACVIRLGLLKREDPWLCIPRAGWRSVISPTSLATVFSAFLERLARRAGADAGNHRFTAGRGADCPFSRQFADCAARKRSLSSDLRFTYSGAVDAGVCAGLLGGHQRGVADGGDGRL